MENYLYAMSSNASEEYITDALQVLGSPREYVHHFRYALRWVDPELRSILSYKAEPISQKLKDVKVVVCYLYQIQRDNSWEWNCVYPIRVGKLIEAYKTGDDDSDIAHLYFKVGDYVACENDSKDCDEIIRTALQSKYNRWYASLGNPINSDYIVEEKQSKQAFHKICNCLHPDHLRLTTGEAFYPVYVFIEGLKRQETIENPKYDKYSRTSYYDLKEGARYTLEFSTYFPEQPPKFTIELASDSHVFVTPAEYKLTVASRYDEEAWPLVSRLLQSSTWSSIVFRSNLDMTEKKPLNVSFAFPVLITRRMLFRAIETGGDICFAFGTFALALSKALANWNWWYIPVAIFFPLWAISKILVRWWWKG